MSCPFSSLSRSLSADARKLAGGRWAVIFLFGISTSSRSEKVTGSTFMMEAADSSLVNMSGYSSIMSCNQVGNDFRPGMSW